MTFRSAVFAFCSILACTALAGAQADVKDHPLVSRFPGSVVVDHKVADFDQFLLPLGKIIEADKFTKAQTLAGKITSFRYSVPSQASTLEIERSYQDALQKGGFEVLFRCTGNECADKSAQGNSKNTASGRWCYLPNFCG